jgi:hypothetical protein
MSKAISVVEFNNQGVRRVEHQGEWYFSVVDIVAILTNTKAQDKGAYWRKLKERLINEGANEVVTNCHDLKLPAPDGKMYKTDCADVKTIFRIIQSIPSPKAEPIKQWLAKVGYERMQEIENPELAQERMMETYRQKGYDEAWIHRRIQVIKNRKELTNEWDIRGAVKNDYEIFTALMSKETFNVLPSQHKKIKKLKRQNLRDHMTDIELALVNIGELTAKELHKTRNTKGRNNLAQDVKEAGKIAGNTRKEIEQKTGKKILSKNNYLGLTKNKPNKIEKR